MLRYFLCVLIIGFECGVGSRDFVLKVIVHDFHWAVGHVHAAPAFHPQSLGSLERSHHSLVEYLKQFGSEQNWDLWLRFAMFLYNTSIHEATGFAPHTLVFGREANIPSSFARCKPEQTYSMYLDDLLKRLTETQSTAEQRLISAKWKSKRYYEQKLNMKPFRVGDVV